MHEFSITSSIIDILKKVVSEKKVIKVDKINIEINPLASIEPESVRFYYDYLTASDPILKGAELNFVKASMEIKCKNCNFIYKTDDIFLKCPKCGSYSGSGLFNPDMDDIRIISIDAENDI